MEEVKICKCCGRKKVAGNCIVNGIRRNLRDTCRYCFMRNPEDRELGKRNRSNNYYRHHKE